MSYINILDSQSLFYKQALAGQIALAQNKEDVYYIQSRIFRDFYNNAYVSSIYKEDESKLNKTYFNDITGRVIMDINILFEESKLVSDEIAIYFNESKDHRTRTRNKTEYLLSLISNLNIMNQEESERAVSFYDALSNYNYIDDEAIIGDKAVISTAEGLAHLATTRSSVARLSDTKIKISGNGTLGNYGSVTPLPNPIDGYTHKFISDIDSHDSLEALFDGQNNTWIEYQSIGSNEVSKQKKEEEKIWLSETAVSETLMLTLLIDTGSTSYYNWLDILQYIPDDSRNGIIVYKINTSIDGVNWSPLYPDREIINQRIYAVPQSVDITYSSSSNKAISQGTFVFSRTRFKYLEIILLSDSSYTKERSLGFTRYTATAKDIAAGVEIEKEISAKDLPEELLLAPQGTYNHRINGSLFGHQDVIDATIKKRVIPVSGWRYNIGVREIELSDREYAQSSVLITKAFETEAPIEKIVLYSKEIIPQEFIETGVQDKSTWIKYFFSIDNKTWYPISPIHHNPVSDQPQPPKFYDFNKNISYEVRNTMINTEFIDTEEPVTKIKLKIEFNRPEFLRHLTPILESYTLKCYLED